MCGGRSARNKKGGERKRKREGKRRIEIKGWRGGKFRGKSLHGSYPLSRRVGGKC